MQEERIFLGNTLEEVAKAFAEEISRNYLQHLKFWQATAMDEPHEFHQWEEKIKNEPGVVKRNAFEKILKIMKNPEDNKQYFKKKYGFLRSKDVIGITKSSGFYQDLLPGEDIEHTVSVNVEYLIDKRYMTVVKKIYSQDARL